MKKIIAILTPDLADHTGWNRTPNKFIQLFTGLTGYDIMLEESRRDLPAGNDSGANSGQIMSGLLSGSIKKCLVLFGRESCKYNR
jgi:hypothetical protein